MNLQIMDNHLISIYIGILGIIGTAAFFTIMCVVMWHYRDSRIQSFRWRLRNWRLMKLSALACLFFLAMAASYGVLQEAWGWLYLIGAFKTGTWWVRYTISRGV